MDRANLRPKVRTAIRLAAERAWNVMHADGHWCAEIRANVTVTAEHIFFYASLGKPPPGGYAPFQRFIQSQQNPDGSWGLAPSYPGDVSTSCEAYLALKMCGLSVACETMQRARAFILSKGGVAKVRVFTRIFLAMFGLFPWSAVPNLPPEAILLPAWCPLNVYKLASWARSTVIPLLLIRHHKPIYRIPGVGAEQQSWLDEIWLDPESKSVPYSPPISELWNRDVTSLLFAIGDRILSWLTCYHILPLRRLARKRCVDWIIEHQESQGDWAGIVMPMICSVQALLLEGYSIVDPVIDRGLTAIERFAYEDEAGRRVQACVSPHWDTVLMITSLCETASAAPKRLHRCVEWVTKRQQLVEHGDWRIYNPQLRPGGFSFEYNNSWYPDVDDTAATVLALLKYNARFVHSNTVLDAINWILGMQSKSGGWAAFDTNNDKLWLNKIPFSDMDALCDPPTADITGRVLEAFGLAMDICRELDSSLPALDRMDAACDRGIAFLCRQQETDGSWFGRWGSNYLYGTSAVLCGLQRFVIDRDDVRDMVGAAVEWIKTAQNADGGWGEDLMSYKDSRLAGRGVSSASQTAWALMGLLSHLSSDDESVAKGIHWLLTSQTEACGDGGGASWPEMAYTGTGFPGHFYFGYDLYRHYFPMMALGRYLKRSDEHDGDDRVGDADSVDSGAAGLGTATAL
ncbi:squalene-hopene cyclase [Verruconis gallopava]|uniref:Terpene cyclase/mutase family member n=1 Tax=Verruconis gallopava TaxID=253628 RepID=A0A0D2AMC5_9PEZI|nr:squalene-hopene cyclase [Verruconis gallopava]KIW00289.1 squalene-hopene cyclase [Verruconis gallopava]